LRDKVENDSAEPQTFTANGRQLSQDALGINGDQVWTYAKKGNDFRTIQLLNLMGITSDWKNEDGYEVIVKKGEVLAKGANYASK